MKILSNNSYKGIGKYNNDILNHIGNMYYVMDGATALFEDKVFSQTSDLYEYMTFLKENIKDSASIINNLKEGIKKSNMKIRGLDKQKEYELPTFTIAAMKEYDEYIEVYLLCDCLISIFGVRIDL